MQGLKFDTVVHLAGEQVIPNYMALKLFEARRHVFVVTEQTKKLFGRLERVCSDKFGELGSIVVPPTDYGEIRKKIEALVESLGSQGVAFNITGGTKPMSTAALDVCRKSGATPFYIDTQKRRIHVFVDDYRVLEMPPVFERVDEFVKLAGYSTSARGVGFGDVRSEKLELAMVFWKNKGVAREKIRKFSDATDNKYKKDINPPDCFRDAIDYLLAPERRCAWELGNAFKACFPGAFCKWYDKDNDWREVATFAAGGWFELCMLREFGNAAGEKRILDLQSNISVSFSGDGTDASAQEIDVAFTDGYDLFLVECKAGNVKQEHIQKLENLRRQLGGAFGKAFLCALDKRNPKDLVFKRVVNGSISFIGGDEALRMLPFHFEEVLPGRCYQSEDSFRNQQ